MSIPCQMLYIIQNTKVYVVFFLNICCLPILHMSIPCNMVLQMSIPYNMLYISQKTNGIYCITC